MEEDTLPLISCKLQCQFVRYNIVISTYAISRIEVECITPLLHHVSIYLLEKKICLSVKNFRQWETYKNILCTSWTNYLDALFGEKLLKFAPYSLLWYLAALIYTLPALWIFNHNKFHAWLPRRNSYHPVTGWIGHACQMRAKHRRGMCIAAIHGLNSSDVSLKRYLTENC